MQKYERRMGSRQESRCSEFGAGFINEAMSIVAEELPRSKWARKKHVCHVEVGCLGRPNPGRCPARASPAVRLCHPHDNGLEGFPADGKAGLRMKEVAYGIGVSFMHRPYSVAGESRNAVYAPAELAAVKRGSTPAITWNQHLATIAARPHGAVIPLINALRRQAPQWRKRLSGFFSGDDHRSMGTRPDRGGSPLLPLRPSRKHP